MKRLLLSCLILGLSTIAAHADDHLDELASLMTGSFSSQKQSIDDEDYFDIRLEMVRIWPERTDGIWLYVEQAAASSQEKPYRQRVYRLSEKKGRYLSEIFSFEEPLRFAGHWKTPELFEQLTVKDLSVRTGCTVVMIRIHRGHFRGSTVAENCKSQLRGSAYATAHVNITPQGIESWDRGFNNDGEQVWGAEKGPYTFSK